MTPLAATARAGELAHRPEPAPDAGARTMRAMAMAAETLDERLADARATGRGAGEPADATVLARWAQVVTRGDASGFGRRLAWDDLDAAGAAHALSTPRGTDVAWTEMLHAALGMADAESAGDAPARLVAGLVAVARAQLAARAGKTGARLTAAAHDALASSLTATLAPLARRVAGQAHADTPRALAERYPVLARLACTATTLWVDASLEFLRRLHADHDALAATFGVAGPVSHLRTGLSDPHNGARGVLIAEWANGVSVVYKPRSLGVDARFAELLRWAAPRLGALAIEPLRVLTRTGYGWIECAVPAACASRDGVARYYARCGVLVALVYAMNGTDFHHENLLAAGEQPVLLDLEMLLGPRFALVEELPAAGMADPEAKRDLVESVLNLWMLPAVRPASFPGAVTSGALAEPRGHNAATLDGRPVPASAHVDDIVRGFEAMYAVLHDGAAALLAAGGILDALRAESVRLVVRNTSLYYALLDRALAAEHLASGVEFAMQLDVLARTFLSMGGRPAVWPLVAAERAALTRLDVPLFTARVDSRDLRLPTGVTVRGCFAESAFDMMRHRLEALGDADRARQCTLIRAAFAAAARQELRVTTPSLPTPSSRTAITRAQAIEAACRVADAALRDARRGAHGAIAWAGAAYLPASRRHVVQSMSSGLFDGYGGMALFLAALARITGNDGYRAAAAAAIVPLRRRLAELESLLAMRRASELGIGFGPASAALALAHAGALLDDAGMRGDARRVAATARPALLAHEDTGDLLSGSAGAVVALLSLHTLLGDAWLLDAAVTCGDLLVSRGGPRAWRGAFGEAEYGAAHGIAGMAYALARLDAATGDARYGAASREAIAAERAVLAHRDTLAREETLGAWSHGATGIALARLGGAPASPEDLHELEILLALSRASVGTGGISPCTGDAARAALLADAARRLGRPSLGDEAAVVAGAIARQLMDVHAVRTTRALSSGLFGGDAGAAYTLLHLVEPDVVPSPFLMAG